jgi:exoribonuclease R
VERYVRKTVAALLLHDRVGEVFDGIVTGVNPHGTYARTVRPPAEGRVMRGEQGLDVGDKVRVKLIGADPNRGFIDFEALGKGSGGNH